VAWFQTNPCGVEASSTIALEVSAGFRRTLVGLKHDRQGPRVLLRHLFQTNPCGVEAPDALRVTLVDAGFRRTLVGLKQRGSHPAESATMFQTNPCGVEARALVGGRRRQPRVSDEPLWG